MASVHSLVKGISLLIEHLFERQEALVNFLIELQLKLVKELVPLLELEADKVLEVLLFVLLCLLVGLQLLHSSQLVDLLIKLLVHFHQNFNSEIYLIDGVGLLSYVMPFMASKESTRVTNLLFALDADQVAGFAMLEAH